MTQITCCYDCNTRYRGCHDNCKQYQQQKKQMREQKEKIRKEKSFDRYFFESVRRCANLNKGGRFISAMWCK